MLLQWFKQSLSCFVFIAICRIISTGMRDDDLWEIPKQASAQIKKLSCPVFSKPTSHHVFQCSARPMDVCGRDNRETTTNAHVFIFDDQYCRNNEQIHFTCFSFLHFKLFGFMQQDLHFIAHYQKNENKF